MRKDKNCYHHGNLAESLLDAVDEIASKFGLEAVTLRACAKLVGVSPSSAFRHYADKRTLMTAFATRAIHQLSHTMQNAQQNAQQQEAFMAVSLAYVEFALENPAFFRAMWREEAIYCHDPDYRNATNQLGMRLKGGFANTIEDQDPDRFSPQELLAWSAMHGLANLFIDGPMGKALDKKAKLQLATDMIQVMQPVL